MNIKSRIMAFFMAFAMIVGIPFSGIQVGNSGGTSFAASRQAFIINNTESDKTNADVGDQLEVITSGYTKTSNLKYRWEYSLDGENDWTTIQDSNGDDEASSTLTVDSDLAKKYIRIYTYKLNSGKEQYTAYSDELFISELVDYSGLPDPGEIGIQKVMRQYGDEIDDIEITIAIDGRDLETATDIVLVLDSSGSMGWETEDKDIRMDVAKVAAEDFIDNLLTPGSDIRIAIIDFDSTVKSVSDFYGYEDKTTLKSALNSLEAEGGTNIQDGIYEARMLFDEQSDPDTIKHLVVLSDGDPTYAFKGSTISPYGDLINNDSPISHDFLVGEYDYSNYIGSGTSYLLSAVYFGAPYTYSIGDTEINDTAISTISEAKLASGILVDESNLNNYPVDFMYGIGFGVTSNSVASYVLENIATSSDQYYSTASNLEPVFEDIADNINYAATNANVIDPMGDYFVVDDSFGDDTFIVRVNGETTSPSGENYSDAVSYDEGTRTINWTVGDIHEYDASTPIIDGYGFEHPSYITLTYKIKFDRDESDIPFNEVLLTNKTTTIYYDDAYGEENSKDFSNIPKISIGGGTITLIPYRVDSNGAPVSEAGAILDDSLISANALKPLQELGSEGGIISTDGSMAMLVDGESVFSLGTYTVDSSITDNAMESLGYKFVGESQTITTSDEDKNVTVFLPYELELNTIEEISFIGDLDATAVEFDTTDSRSDGKYIYEIIGDGNSDASNPTTNSTINFTVSTSAVDVEYVAIDLEVAPNTDKLSEPIVVGGINLSESSFNGYDSTYYASDFTVEKIMATGDDGGEIHRLMIKSLDGKYIPSGDYSIAIEVSGVNGTKVSQDVDPIVQLSSIKAFDANSITSLADQDATHDLEFYYRNVDEFKLVEGDEGYDSADYSISLALEVKNDEDGGGNDNDYFTTTFGDIDTGIFEKNGSGSFGITINPSPKNDTYNENLSFKLVKVNDDGTIDATGLSFEITKVENYDPLDDEGLAIPNIIDLAGLELHAQEGESIIDGIYIPSVPKKADLADRSKVRIYFDATGTDVDDNYALILTRSNGHDIDDEDALAHRVEILKLMKFE